MSRSIKVERTGDFFRGKTTPSIRLKGKWLAKAGFPPDSRIVVTSTQAGVLELRLQPIQI